MKETSPLQDQLRSLSIPREQRPRGRTSAGAQVGRRLSIAAIVAGVIVLGGYLGWHKLVDESSSGSAAAAEQVSLLKVMARSEGDSSPVLTATGKIVSDHQVAVSTKVSGQIVALYFEQGDRIERGQILARIEDDIYRARRDEAAGQLEKARAELEFQKVNFDRIARLFHDQQAPDIEYAQAKRSLDQAQATVVAAEAALAGMDKMLRDCEVLAPIAGVVLERNVEVGDFVAAEGGRGAMANSQFAAIADMEQLRVEIDVSELDIQRLHRDMPCVVIPDAHKDRKYTGHLMWIDPGANYAKATVQVKVRIHDPDEFLRVEGAAQVQFLNGPRAADPRAPDPRAPDLGRGAAATTQATAIDKAADPAPVAAATSQSATDSALAVTAPTTQQAPNIWIPLAACRPDSSGKSAAVLVAADGRFKEATVSLGRRESSNVEVVSGLTVGQEIAADIQKAKAGQRVRQ
jgi:HlyD family secretion protein